MLNNFEKTLIFVVILFIMFPNNFAADIETDFECNRENYYFNSSIDCDGDGSYVNPYKFLNASRIKENSNIFLASGDYHLDSSLNIKNVSIHGENQNKTRIHYNGVAFNTENYFFIESIKLCNLSINNTGNMVVNNCILEGDLPSSGDEYRNIYGGTIHSFNGNLSVNNCIFKNTYAEYGGAIYVDSGILKIINSEFLNTASYNWGGAISCINNAKCYIFKTKFLNTLSLNDAGGAIYLESSYIEASGLCICNVSASFGGAITILKSNSSFANSNFINNCAKWDGGAIFQFYGNLNIHDSNFINNHAQNGGALFINNLDNVNISNNIFTLNNISAIYSKFCSILNQNNTFNDNQSIIENNNINLNIGSGNYTMVKLNSTQYRNLPTYYSLVDEKQVTDVKNQQTSGNCWAFSSIAVLESCILKATGKYVDLSEENMKNIMALYSDYGWNLDTNNGAYAFMPLNYLVNWMGPVNEMDDKYDDKSTISPILNSSYHIQNIKFLRHDNFTDNNEIKQALIQYGAVGVGMAYNDYFLNKKTNGYYCYANANVNHAVAIVGWDDNYSKYNFRWSSLIKGDGAWIVRNSWGNDWANDGYFYVSYYDPKFALTTSNYVPYTFILNETIKKDKNYQYDLGGLTNYFITPQNNVYYKNIFIATDNEFLTSVSTFFEKQTNWTLSINVNNVSWLIQSGISNPGYCTVDLKQFISLSKGDIFEIIFNVTTSKQVSFPISEAKYLNKLTYSFNLSFVSFEGVKWFDLYNLTYSYLKHDYSSQVACIKAFTILNPINTYLSLKINDTLLIAQVMDQYGNFLRYGNVTFDLDGQNYVVGIKNGYALFNSPIIKNKTIISAIFDAVGYTSSNQTSIQKSSNDLKVSIVKNSNNILIDLFSLNNDNQTIIVEINNEKHNISLINGRQSFMMSNLSNGIYDISVISPDLGVNQIINISLVETKLFINEFESGDGNFSVTLLDSNGCGISNKTLEFFLNDVKYTLVTGSGGNANLPCLVEDGNYLIKIFFRGDGDYRKSEIMRIIQVSSPIKAVLNVFKYSNNAIIKINSSKLMKETIIKVNGKNYYIGGDSTLVLSNLSNGLYNASLYINNNFINSTYFVIHVKNSTRIVLTNITSDNGCFNYTVRLLDGENKGIFNRSISIILNNMSYNCITDSNGYVNVLFNISAGKYGICAVFDGDDDFIKSNQSGIINVLKKNLIKTMLTSPDWTTYYKSNSNYSIVLTDMDNNPLQNRSIIFEIDGEKYIKRTDVNGLAFININLEVGDYSMHLSFLGDEYYSNSSNSSKILVKSSIITEDYSIKTCNSFYSIKLLNDAGETSINSKAYLLFDNIGYLKTSDENGYVYLPINTDAGVHMLIIINLDTGEELIRNINVVSRISQNHDLVMFEYETQYYKVLVLDDNAHPLLNTFVKITINNKVYDVKTNSVGFASLKLCLHAGKYAITVQSKSFKVSNKIVVNPIIMAKNIVVKKSKSFKFSVKLLNKAKNKKITFKFKNKKYVAKTNKKGVASVIIKIKLKRGVYKIYSSYNKSKISNKVIIR